MADDEPNLSGIYGGTANPLRQVFMIGVIWRLAGDFGGEPLDLVEVGSWAGASALTWGQGLEEHNHGHGSLTCIDAWEPYYNDATVPDAFGREINQALKGNKPYQVFKRNIKYLPSSVDLTIHRDWSANVLPTLIKDRYHLVYLDGNHTYNSVSEDIRLGCPLIRDGGIICGDDLEIQLHELDVSDVIDKPEADKWTDPKTDIVFHPGVARAVAECFGEVSSWSGFWAMRRDGNSWTRLSLEGMPGVIPKFLDKDNLMGLKALLMHLN